MGWFLSEMLTWVVPRQKLEKEGVVMGELLTRGSFVSRSPARGGQVRQLVRRLCMLVLDILG